MRKPPLPHREEAMSVTFMRSMLAVAALGALSVGVQAQELKLWTLNFANDSENRAFHAIVEDFQKANPGVTIKVEPRGTDEHKTALRVASGSNQMPDIYFMWA